MAAGAGAYAMSRKKTAQNASAARRGWRMMAAGGAAEGSSKYRDVQEGLESGLYAPSRKTHDWRTGSLIEFQQKRRKLRSRRRSSKKNRS